VHDQLYAATVYYNKLIELEHARQREFREARQMYWPELSQAEDEVDRLRQQRIDAEDPKAIDKQLKAIASKASKLRKIANADLQSADKKIAERKEGLSTHKAGRARIEAIEALLQDETISDWWKAKAKLDEKYHQLFQAARTDASHGHATNRAGERVVALHSGTLEKTKDAADAAWKAWRGLISPKTPEQQARAATITPKQRAKAVTRGRPVFRRYDGSGVLWCQLGHATMDRASVPDASEKFQIEGSWLQIELTEKRVVVPDKAHVAPTPGSKRQVKKAAEPGWGVARLRIGSNPDRTPIWVEVPVYIHRRPSAGRINWGALVVKREGPRLRYELQLTLERKEFGQLPPGKGTAAINIGWRSLGNGEYRIAYLVDEYGNEEALTLKRDFHGSRPRRPLRKYSVVDRLMYVDELQSNSNTHFDSARDALRDWVKEHEVSAGLKLVTRNIGKWRNPAKLVRAAKVLISESAIDSWSIWDQWKSERLRDELDLFAPREEVGGWCAKHGLKHETEQFAAYLLFWKMKQTHLYLWQERQRAKAIARRRDLFLSWIKKVTSTYKTILVEDYDLTGVKSVCKKEKNENRQTKKARRNRAYSAPGQLRDMLYDAAPNKVIKQDTATEEGSGASQKCTKCGRSSQVDLRPKVVVTCPCGHAEDQDQRNCKNRLTEYFSTKKAA